mmetsp:Transcript_10380/g.24703  ORF Transcript_10380/g.24703 Transcript_10380/m.24703 type:complete len:227 (+) Transcript_10380:1518-2198(+)
MGPDAVTFQTAAFSLAMCIVGAENDGDRSPRGCRNTSWWPPHLSRSSSMQVANPSTSIKVDFPAIAPSLSSTLPRGTNTPPSRTAVRRYKSVWSRSIMEGSTGRGCSTEHGSPKILTCTVLPAGAAILKMRGLAPTVLPTSRLSPAKIVDVWVDFWVYRKRQWPAAHNSVLPSSCWASGWRPHLRRTSTNGSWRLPRCTSAVSGARPPAGSRANTTNLRDWTHTVS